MFKRGLFRRPIPNFLSLAFLQQLSFAHVLLIQGALLCLLPPAKLVGRNPDRRVDEFLLVLPL